jgi:hypothetical protein
MSVVLDPIVLAVILFMKPTNNQDPHKSIVSAVLDPLTSFHCVNETHKYSRPTKIDTVSAILDPLVFIF